MWKQFYFSSDFDLLILGLLILVTIGVFIGSFLYFFSFREKKKQIQLMEQTLCSFNHLSQLVQGDMKMKFDLNEILAEHQSVTNPTQTHAISKDIAIGLKNLTSVGAALAGNLGRIAVNTGIQQQTENLSALNQQIADLAEVIANNTTQDCEKAAIVALGQQQQAIAKSSTASTEAKKAVGVVNEEKNIPDDSPFSIHILRQMIRDTECLKNSYRFSNPGQSIANDFEIRQKDVRNLISVLIAKEKQGKLDEIKQGKLALKFLQEEYNPVA